MHWKQKARKVPIGFPNLQGGLHAEPKCVLSYKMCSQAASCKVCSHSPFNERLENGHYLPTEPQGESHSKCLYTCPVSLILSHGYKSFSLSDIGFLRTHPSSGCLKSWATICVAQSLCSLGSSWMLEISSWLDGTVLRVEFKYRVCLSLSYSFQSGYFLSGPIYGSHPAGFLSERITHVQLYI